MAYHDQLAERLRRMLRRRKNVTERNMFGGIAFLVNGHMACGVQGTATVWRIGRPG